MTLYRLQTSTLNDIYRDIILHDNCR